MLFGTENDFNWECLTASIIEKSCTKCSIYFT